MAGGLVGSGMTGVGRGAKLLQRAANQRTQSLAYLATELPQVPASGTSMPPPRPEPYCGRLPGTGTGLGTICSRDQAVGHEERQRPLPLQKSALSASGIGVKPQQHVPAEGSQTSLKGKGQGRIKAATGTQSLPDPHGGNQAGALAETRAEATGTGGEAGFGHVEESRSVAALGRPELLVKPHTKRSATGKSKRQKPNCGKIPIGLGRAGIFPGLSTCTPSATPSGVLAFAEMSQAVAEPPSSSSHGGLHGAEEKPAADRLPSAADAPQPDALQEPEPKADDADQPMVRLLECSRIVQKAVCALAMPSPVGCKRLHVAASKGLGLIR